MEKEKFDRAQVLNGRVKGYKALQSSIKDGDMEKIKDSQFFWEMLKKDPEEAASFRARLTEMTSTRITESQTEFDKL